VSLIVNNEEQILRALADTDASSSTILETYNSYLSIKTDENDKLHGFQRVVNLLLLKLGYACDIFTSRVQSQETNKFLGCFTWVTILSNQKHMIRLSSMKRDHLRESGIIIKLQ
jgi:hypothetical protein